MRQKANGNDPNCFPNDYSMSTCTCTYTTYVSKPAQKHIRH